MMQLRESRTNWQHWNNDGWAKFMVVVHAFDRGADPATSSCRGVVT